MQENIIHLILTPAAISLLIATILVPLTIKLAPYLGIMDDPSKRNHPATLHKKTTPRGGGLPIYLAITTTSLLLLPLDKKLIGILVGGAIVVLVGLVDDKKSLNPYHRLIAQFITAGVVIASGIGISFISNPLGGGTIDLSNPKIFFYFLGETRSIWILSAGFALLWIVALMNAINWSSGVDGQLSGTIVIASLAIAILSLRFSADITQWPVTILAAATLGAFLGFLPWHIYPQKIMPGFGGATIAGFMLAVLSILATTKVGTLMVILAIPLVDAGYSITRRILQGKSPVWGDAGHLHHKLLAAGWSKQKVALFYWSITAVLAILALNLNAQAKLYTIITTALIIGGSLLWLNSLFQQSKQQDPGNG